MTDKIIFILQSEIDCSVHIDDVSVDLMRLDKPKVFEIADLSSVTLKVFPFDEVPFATKLEWGLHKPTKSTEKFTMFWYGNICYLIIHQNKQLMLLQSTKQLEIECNQQKANLVANVFEHYTSLSFFANHKNISATVPFAANHIYSFPFSKICAIVCESDTQKALLLTDGKQENMEVFLADMIGYDNNSMQVYTANQTLCKHATVVTLTQNGTDLDSDTKLVFEQGSPHFAFSNKLLPIAFLECLQLSDFKTAEQLITMQMRRMMQSDDFLTFVKQAQTFYYLPMPENKMVYGVVQTNGQTSVIEAELVQDKLNQLYLIKQESN